MLVFALDDLQNGLSLIQSSHYEDTYHYDSIARFFNESIRAIDAASGLAQLGYDTVTVLTDVEHNIASFRDQLLHIDLSLDRALSEYLTSALQEVSAAKTYKEH